MLVPQTRRQGGRCIHSGSALLLVSFYQFWLQRLGVQGNSNSAFLLEKLVSKSGDLNLAVSIYSNKSAYQPRLSKQVLHSKKKKKRLPKIFFFF